MSETLTKDKIINASEHLRSAIVYAIHYRDTKGIELSEKHFEHALGYLFIKDYNEEKEPDK